MAKSLGAEVYYRSYAWDDPFISEEELDSISRLVSQLKPKLITAVHCETPSGALNTYIKDLGKISETNNSIFVVDIVSSIACIPIDINVGFFSKLLIKLN